VAYPTWNAVGPTSCCANLSLIANCSSAMCVNDGSSICAYCGNNVCGLGETKYNCPADCAN
jgi:hypothetical protein